MQRYQTLRWFLLPCSKVQQCQQCHKTGHFTNCCFKKQRDNNNKQYPKRKDIHGIRTTDDGNNNEHSSDESNNNDAATNTSISSQDSFFIGSIKTMNINKVTDDENHNLFLVDLLIITKKHKRKHVIHLKSDSAAEKLIMTRKSYVTLTGDKFFQELDEPKCQLKGYGPNANIKI